jgi:LacI family transcriptional regulator
MKRKVERVALLLESDVAFDRGIARGIGDYIRNHKGWVVLMDPLMEVTLEGLEHWKPDGILASINLPAINDILSLSDVPIVGFGSYDRKRHDDLGIPVVSSDQEEIGRMAARHFINKGLKHFAFCGGDEHASWCRKRLEGFTEELAKEGFSPIIFQSNFQGHLGMLEAVKAVALWLQGLPKPTGVFVFFDGWARWVLDACVLEGLRVPQEIAVLGVDNDRWLCELAQPRLCSIDPNVETAGYVAAEMLDGLLRNPHLPAPKARLVAPAGVVERDSSNFLAFDDPLVAVAVRYIREHACDPITTADVLEVTGMSNSTAYRRFMKELGRPIHAQIQRAQMDRVKELLTATNLKVTQIATQAGFSNIRYLTKVFRDATGQTPTEYRRLSSSPDVTGSRFLG